MRPARTDRIVIAQLSDLHCGGPRYDQAMLERAIDAVNDLCPDLVVVAGDLTGGGYRDEFLLAKEQIDRITCPEITIVPGNHDSRNVGYLHFTDLFSPRWEQRELALGESGGKVGHERIRVVALDSSKPDLDDGELGRHRHEWLAQQLEGPPAFTIVAGHHHLVSIPGTGRERNVVLDAGDVLAILDRYSVDLVLAGHKHVPYVWQVNGMLIVTSGTAGTWRTRGETPPSYNVVTVTRDEIEVAFMPLDGSSEPQESRFPRRR